MMWGILSLVVFLGVLHRGLSETGCPEPDQVAPCQCTDYPNVNLLCRNLNEADVLRKVFVNSERYKYRQVKIENSTIQHIPYDLFKNVEVIELYLKNVVLTQLFDKPPEGLNELQMLQIDNCKILRGLIWKSLAPIKTLLALLVNYTSIKTLGSEFNKYIPKDFKRLELKGTETQSIKPGAFENVKNLALVIISNGQLRTLRRDMFPTPSYVMMLSFSDNKISTIPEGCFTQMPYLWSIDLAGNQIATLPQQAFDMKISAFSFLGLDENPLKCDCLLVWMMDAKPNELKGVCETPKRLLGRSLEDLQRTDFNC